LPRDRKGAPMIAFLGSFLQYIIIMLILIAVAVLGVFMGIRWTKRDEKKKASDSTSADSRDVTD